jgi:hypothetical protein
VEEQTKVKTPCREQGRISMAKGMVKLQRKRFNVI